MKQKQIIPKTIHSVWVGNGNKKTLIQHCEKSWKNYCPDFKFIEWSEKNFNIETAPQYVKEAYDHKKWAFVSDYIRVWALYNYGGVYLDSDVEIIKNIYPLLENKAFTGFEEGNYIQTAIIGSAQGNDYLKEILEAYENKKFEINTPETNVLLFTKFFEKKGLAKNNSKQEIGNFSIFPKEYFAPKNYLTGKTKITKKTFCIHHFDGSWLTPFEKFKLNIHHFLGF